MIDHDRESFAALLLGLGETYGESVSPARMEIYFAALSDLDLDEIRAAANVHVRMSKFFPRPAELREAIQGAADDRADLAWMAVLRLVRRIGYYSKPTDRDWPDEATRRAALEMFGGWQALCAKLPGEGPELIGIAKQFKATYRAYDMRGQRQGLPPGETGRELSASESAAALRELKVALQSRGLPTHDL